MNHFRNFPCGFPGGKPSPLTYHHLSTTEHCKVRAGPVSAHVPDILSCQHQALSRVPSYERSAESTHAQLQSAKKCKKEHAFNLRKRQKTCASVSVHTRNEQIRSPLAPPLCATKLLHCKFSRSGPDFTCGQVQVLPWPPVFVLWVGGSW